jgi:hypothetical protein
MILGPILTDSSLLDDEAPQLGVALRFALRLALWFLGRRFALSFSWSWRPSLDRLKVRVVIKKRGHIGQGWFALFLRQFMPRVMALALLQPMAE